MTDDGGPGMQTARSRARGREGGGAVGRGREAVYMRRREAGVCVCWTDAHVDRGRVVESFNQGASSLDSIQANAMEGSGFGVSGHFGMSGFPLRALKIPLSIVMNLVRPRVVYDVYKLVC
jgi:hypothetical protein